MEFSKETIIELRNGKELPGQLIAHSDLAGFYRAPDGIVWCRNRAVVNSGWSNCGRLTREIFEKRYIGKWVAE